MDLFNNIELLPTNEPKVINSLNKLQQLCNNVNRRYQAGLNDDDQVKALFDYAKKNHCVCVVVGYDDYNGITAYEVLQMYKSEPEAEVIHEKNGFSCIKMNYKKHIISTSLLITKI
jgi:hypothetical protein